MRRIARHLGIVATAIVVSAGVMGVAAPVAQAKTIDKAEWAKGFCNAVKDWQVSVMKANALIDDVATNGVTSPAEAKSSQKRIAAALDAAAKGSTGAAKALKSLGAPDIADGAKISATVSTAVGNTAKVFSDAKATVAKASTVPAKFQTKLKSVTEQIDKDYAKAGEDIGGIKALAKGGVLDNALNAEPACAFANGT